MAWMEVCIKYTPRMRILATPMALKTRRAKPSQAEKEADPTPFKLSNWPITFIPSSDTPYAPSITSRDRFAVEKKNTYVHTHDTSLFFYSPEISSSSLHNFLKRISITDSPIPPQISTPHHQDSSLSLVQFMDL